MSLQFRFIATIILIFAVFCIDVVATKLYLYWTFIWLDKAMHFFGGFLAGNMVLIGRQVVAIARKTESMTKWELFAVAVFGALLVGILWEIFEFQFGISHLGPDFVSDTVTDLIMDVIGGMAAYIAWITIPHKTA